MKNKHCLFILVCFFLGFVLNGCGKSDDVKDAYESPTLGGVEGGIPELPFDPLDPDEGSQPVQGGNSSQTPIDNPSPETPRNSKALYFVAYLPAANNPSAPGSANTSTPSFDSSLPTHVILVSSGRQSGLLFQTSAVTRALKYQDQYPDHQVMLITSTEKSADYNRDKLLSWGFLIGREGDEGSHLGVSVLRAQLEPLKQIQTFEVYSHANENGLELGTEFLYWNEMNRLSFLKRKLSARSWAGLFGCNTGWKSGPRLASVLRVPVFSSFSGAHFERLHSLGEFYPYDELRAPAGPFSLINPLSFQKQKECVTGGCSRMKPDPHPYVGRWGQQEQGLGFYKFFCGGLSEDDCFSRMAESLTVYASTKRISSQSSKKDFEDVLFDFMCPIHKSKSWREDCKRQTKWSLAKNREEYSPFLGKELTCDFSSCRATEETSKSPTFIREVKAYLKGYQLNSQQVDTAP